MDDRGPVGIARAQQHRADAGRHGRGGVNQGPGSAVVQDIGMGCQGINARLHPIELRAAHQRTHAHFRVAGVARHHAGQLGTDRLGHRSIQRGRNQDAADCGALLTGGAVRSVEPLRQSGIQGFAWELGCQRCQGLGKCSFVGHGQWVQLESGPNLHRF